jgi:acyl-CoA thioesterase
MMADEPINALEASLAIEQTGPGLWAAVASPQYEANSGMFGGWTAALLLKTILSEAESAGSASAMTVNFVNRVVPGARLEVRTIRLGGGRSLTHWRCDVLSENSLLATAVVVLADRKESSVHTEVKMPAAPPHASIQLAILPGTFGSVVEVRPTLGDGLFNQTTTRSLNWERDGSGRPMDAVQLAFLSDLGAPRIFFVSDGPRPSSTITLSIYFHATSEELAACSDDYILCDMVGTRANAATIASRKDMWGRNGALLATSEQLCWFR